VQVRGVKVREKWNEEHQSVIAEQNILICVGIKSPPYGGLPLGLGDCPLGGPHMEGNTERARE